MAAVSTSQLLRGLPEVKARLDRVAAAADDLSPVWSELGRLFADRQRTVFATNGLGDKWAAPAASTIREHQSPLVDTGVMRSGLIESGAIWARKLGAAWGAQKADKRVMNIAVLNTVGHKSRGATMVPPRVVVPRLRAAERRAWVGVVRDYMARAVR